MRITDWVRRVEDAFFDRLEADEALQEKWALITWVGFVVAMLSSLFLGAVTGNRAYLVIGGLWTVATVLAIRTWWRLRSGSATRDRFGS